MLLVCCQKSELGSHSTVLFSLTRMKVFLSMKEKRKITSKAFADNKKKVKATTQKYNIQLDQICRWKHHFDAEAAEMA